MFAMCWANDPASRISISGALEVLDSLDPSYALKRTADQGNGVFRKELIDQLDKESRPPPSTIS